jgi:hypothetical protein
VLGQALVEEGRRRERGVRVEGVVGDRAGSAVAEALVQALRLAGRGVEREQPATGPERRALELAHQRLAEALPSRASVDEQLADGRAVWLVRERVDVEHHGARDLAVLELAREQDRAPGGDRELDARPVGVGVRGRERVEEANRGAGADAVDQDLRQARTRPRDRRCGECPDAVRRRHLTGRPRRFVQSPAGWRIV